MTVPIHLVLAALAICVLTASGSAAHAQANTRPNIVMLMTDDTGWNDFGAYSGGGARLGHSTPNVDRIAKEGAYFTNWYGQASCTAGRASFMTGRIPIRTALSVVVGPGDRNHLAEYLAAEDALGRWLKDRCVLGNGDWTSFKALFADWQQWCEQTGERAGSQKRFTQALQARGFESDRSGGAGTGVSSESLFERTH